MRSQHLISRPAHNVLALCSSLYKGSAVGGPIMPDSFGRGESYEFYD